MCETYEFQPKIRKVRIPDKSGRGRGMPGMPKAGPPRPVFKPPAAGGAAAAGRGRGRGAS